MIVAQEIVGRLFELHPSLGVEGRAAILDLDLALMERLDKREERYQPLRRFPTSAFDLSVVAPLREPAGDIEQLLKSAAGPRSGGNRIRAPIQRRAAAGGSQERFLSPDRRRGGPHAGVG